MSSCTPSGIPEVAQYQVHVLGTLSLGLHTLQHTSSRRQLRHLLWHRDKPVNSQLVKPESPELPSCICTSSCTELPHLLWYCEPLIMRLPGFRSLWMMAPGLRLCM